MTKLKVVSWNIGRRAATLKMLNGSGYDAALLQETPPPDDTWERNTPTATVGKVVGAPGSR